MGNLIGILSRGTESVPAVIESKTIITNGTYAAPEGVDGYNPVIVQVPERQPITTRLEVTENGTYTPGGSVDGYKPVVVNVPQQAAVIESKTITVNGEYAAPEGIDGYSPVIVNVPPESILLTSNNNVVKIYVDPTTNHLMCRFDGLALSSGINNIEAVFDNVAVVNIFKLFNPNLILQAQSYDSTGATKNGWVGFALNTIRAWSQDKYSNITGTFYEIIDLSLWFQYQETLDIPYIPY